MWPAIPTPEVARSRVKDEGPHPVHESALLATRCGLKGPYGAAPFPAASEGG